MFRRMRALILAIGEMPIRSIEPADMSRLIARILGEFERNSDAGIRMPQPSGSCAEWNRVADIDAIAAHLKSNGPINGRDWFVNQEGESMAMIQGPQNGSPDRPANDGPPLAGGRLAIASKEVTIAEIQKFDKAYQPDDIVARDAACRRHGAVEHGRQVLQLAQRTTRFRDMNGATQRPGTRWRR